MFLEVVHGSQGTRHFGAISTCMGPLLTCHVLDPWALFSFIIFGSIIHLIWGLTPLEDLSTSCFSTRGHFLTSRGSSHGLWRFLAWYKGVLSPWRLHIWRPLEQILGRPSLLFMEMVECYSHPTCWGLPSWIHLLDLDDVHIGGYFAHCIMLVDGASHLGEDLGGYQTLYLGLHCIFWGWPSLKSSYLLTECPKFLQINAIETKLTLVIIENRIFFETITMLLKFVVGKFSLWFWPLVGRMPHIFCLRVCLHWGVACGSIHLEALQARRFPFDSSLILFPL